MAGTKAGGLKAAQTNKERHGKNFYAKIGAKGGQNGHTGGFAYKEQCECKIIPEYHHRAQCAGKKGGTKSRRKPRAETIARLVSQER